jgi:hypothetical protein
MLDGDRAKAPGVATRHGLELNQAKPQLRGHDEKILWAHDAVVGDVRRPAGPRASHPFEVVHRHGNVVGMGTARSHARDQLEEHPRAVGSGCGQTLYRRGIPRDARGDRDDGGRHRIELASNHLFNAARCAASLAPKCQRSNAPPARPASVAAVRPAPAGLAS